MEISVTRDALLSSLQRVAGAIERKPVLAVLSNVLMRVMDNNLYLTGTDCEVELVAKLPLEAQAKNGVITVPARKIIDICRSLNSDAMLNLKLDVNRLVVTSGRSRFSLLTLSADDYPNIEDLPAIVEFVVSAPLLLQLLTNTYFSMAQQDVRYFLNGVLFEISNDCISTVATDGHRLALSRLNCKVTSKAHQVIIPRKGVLELIRLLQEDEKDYTVTITANHIKVTGDSYTFNSKLIEGVFPNYEGVLPTDHDKLIEINKNTLKAALARVVILSNEKHHGVRFFLRKNMLTINTNNPEQEEAEEQLEINYQGDNLDVCFNAKYIVDVLSTLPEGSVQLSLKDQEGGLKLMSANTEQQNSIYVIMPMQI